MRIVYMFFVIFLLQFGCGQPPKQTIQEELDTPKKVQAACYDQNLSQTFNYPFGSYKTNPHIFQKYVITRFYECVHHAELKVTFTMKVSQIVQQAGGFEFGVFEHWNITPYGKRTKHQAFIPRGKTEYTYSFMIKPPGLNSSKDDQVYMEFYSWFEKGNLHHDISGKIQVEWIKRK